MDYTLLPEVNTSLNAATTVLLVLGFLRIHRHQDVEGHRRFMLAATACSAAFLVSYLVYHAKVGSVPYTGQGALRVAYFVILISHIVLAAVNVPLVVMTLRYAARDDRPRHRFWARITLPVWLYVSITGVVVYLMLYVFSPAGSPPGD